MCGNIAPTLSFMMTLLYGCIKLSVTLDTVIANTMFATNVDLTCKQRAKLFVILHVRIYLVVYMPVEMFSKHIPWTKLCQTRVTFVLSVCMNTHMFTDLGQHACREGTLQRTELTRLMYILNMSSKITEQKKCRGTLFTHVWLSVFVKC